MKKRYLFVLIILCCVVYPGWSEIKWDAAKFMPLSEVKTGMEGKGYTVFSGTKVEPFDFEVMSIYYNRSPGLHIVWAKGLSDNFKQLVLLEG